MAYKVVGVDTVTSLFPTRVMDALKNVFAQKTAAEPVGLSSATKTYLDGRYSSGTSSSAAATVLTQSTPAKTWTFSHTVGRLPFVSVYTTDGVMVHPDIQATSTSITLTFATAMSGFAILL